MKEHGQWESTYSDGEIFEDEIERQHYFMKKASFYIEKQAEEENRPLTFFVTTFGCQMNAKDSEKLKGILEKVGYVEGESEDEADFVIYNTCTVRDNANQRVYGRLGALGSKKKKNPKKLIALCGCMMQEPSVIEKIKKSYGFVDIIFGTHNLFTFAELLCRRFESTERVIDIWNETDKIVEDLPSERTYSFKSGMNIMYGCNNFCSYCIVPYVRGRERSREPEDIIKEARKLAEDGVIEVMLLGQNVNSYGKDLTQSVNFSQLLKMVEEVDGIERIRFMTSHPKDLSEEVIKVMKHSKKICPHLHLPLQSGSTRILKAMNRKYTKEEYVSLAKKIREEIEDISITTDIIVGFPGETMDDVKETLEVIQEVEFDGAFTFLYSKRTGTPAASMKDQVAKEVMKEGFSYILDAVQKMTKKRASLKEGKVMDVLVEEINKQDSSLVSGRLGNNMMVHFPGGKELIGKIVPVYLKESKGFYFLGEKCVGNH